MQRRDQPDPNDPGRWPRLFAVAEANALLPTLIPLLTRLRAAKAALDDARGRLARLSPGMRANGHAGETMELEAAVARFAREIGDGLREIAAHGVGVKDLDLGLIDFPSPRDGRVVFLCWRLGEGPIAFWHDVDAGFAGRRPL